MSDNTVPTEFELLAMATGDAYGNPDLRARLLSVITAADRERFAARLREQDEWLVSQEERRKIERSRREAETTASHAELIAEARGEHADHVRWVEGDGRPAVEAVAVDVPAPGGEAGWIVIHPNSRLEVEGAGTTAAEAWANTIRGIARHTRPEERTPEDLERAIREWAVDARLVRVQADDAGVRMLVRR